MKTLVLLWFVRLRREQLLKRFVEGLDRSRSTLSPETLEGFVAEDNPVRVIEVFVEGLDLGGLGFGRVAPKATGRPVGRNVEVMWLTGRLVPGHKTIADVRKDNGAAIRKV